MTRMWMVPPQMMCRQHLLGEHKEIHQFLGTLERGHSVRGYLIKGLVEPQNMRSRHDALALEMRSRGYDHRSPLEVPGDLEIPLGRVSAVGSVRELAERCGECRVRIEDFPSVVRGDEVGRKTQRETAIEAMQEGLDTEQVLDRLYRRFPDTRADRGTVALYRWQARKEGRLGPNEGGGKGANRRTLDG